MNDVENRLRRLTPPPPDAARLAAAAYEAGRRDGRSPVTAWRVAAGLLLAATLGLAATRDRAPTTPPPRVVEVAPPPPAVESPPVEVRPPHPASYAALRGSVSADGTVDFALPPPRPSSSGVVADERRVPRVGDSL